MRVLVVCTANQCRSPMGEVLLRARLVAAGVDGLVLSAGRMVGDQPASKGAVIAMRERGLDLADHRSQTCSPDHLRGADLVLCMAREHVRDTVLSHPESFPRTFTLKELARRGAAIGARGPDEDVRSWLTRAHQGRTHADLLGDSRQDDVADPMGGTPEQYEATAKELEALLDRIMALLFPASTRRAVSVG